MEKTSEVTLARTLGLGSIILLGIGALLGGGIFTLLGPAAGLVGPGLFLSMVLGASVAFLNLQMYIALGTTFPEAGGGYLWVRKGLGNFQGFLAGWISWFAHAAACGVYALSFGFYVHGFLRLVGVNLGIALGSEEKIFALIVIIIFGYLNWRGAKTTGQTGNWITLGLLAILGLFIIFGIAAIFKSPEPLANYQPLLPSGILGILAAASFFYIAFEGSEIQVQAGEETRDPQRNIKRGLFISWGVVSALYILISLTIVGVENWQIVAGYGEGAIAEIAAGLMPMGRLLMIVGGIFANLAALNATIYSSSRVSFALARDKNIWSRLANIHLTNLTPHISVIVSTILIALMVIVLPLFDVAAMASLLFVLLFLQLNIAGINIHYKWPETKWYYKVPFFPITPILAIILYSALALTMLKINLMAWVVAAFWALLGFVNYFAYSETQSREQFETGIVYEETLRIGPKIGKRILLPLASELSDAEIKNFAEISFALAGQFGGEVVVVKVHEIAPAFQLDPSMIDEAVIHRERQIFDNLQKQADEFNKKTGQEVKDINFHGLILIGRDMVDVILNVIKMEDCDILMLNWESYTQTKGVFSSHKLDRILRESKCGLLVIKSPKPINNMLVAVHPAADSPYLGLMGEVTFALSNYFKAPTELFSVLSSDTPVYLKPDPAPILKALKLKRKDFAAINFVMSPSPVKAILDESLRKNIDLVIIAATQPRFLQEIRFGNIAEYLAKNSFTSVMIVKGHEGPTEATWKRIWHRLRS